MPRRASDLVLNVDLINPEISMDLESGLPKIRNRLYAHVVSVPDNPSLLPWGDLYLDLPTTFFRVEETYDDDGKPKYLTYVADGLSAPGHLGRADLHTNTDIFLHEIDGQDVRLRSGIQGIRFCRGNFTPEGRDQVYERRLQIAHPLGNTTLYMTTEPLDS